VPTGKHRGFVRYGEPSGRAPPRALDRRPTDRDVLQGEKCTRSTAVRRTEGADDAHAVRHATVQRHRRDTLNLPFRPFGFLRFTPERFHVLLNSLFKGPVQDGLGRVARSRDDGPSLTPHFPASGFGRGIQCWALPCSLAATEGILVSFFSSA
jgi:hypothetical protein